VVKVSSFVMAIFYSDNNNIISVKILIYFHRFTP
jgi:hypothetical protein